VGRHLLALAAGALPDCALPPFGLVRLLAGCGSLEALVCAERSQLAGAIVSATCFFRGVFAESLLPPLLASMSAPGGRHVGASLALLLPGQ
jgi:hypothetical protein